MGDYAAASEVFAAGLVFARVAAIFMLLPGFGEQAVPPRVRLGIALLISLCLFPIAQPLMPAMPESNSALFGILIREILVGLLIGAILRLFFSSLAVTGEIVSLQTTLSFSQTANPMEAAPSTSLGTFLTVMGVTLIFAANLHHLFIQAVFGSFTLFRPGGGLPVGDAASLAITTVGKSFAMGVQMAAPVLVFALMFNVATGLVGRLMPQFQIFFVASPLSVLFGLSVFALTLGTIGLVWVEGYRDLIGNFVSSR